MFAELESLRGASSDEDKQRRKDVAEQVTIELVRHSVAEQVLVYPKVEEKVSVEEAKRAREEHAEAEETMQRMEKLDADDPAFDDTLATLMREIRQPMSSRRARCSPTCARSSTRTNCAPWAPGSRPSSRWRRPVRTRACPTRRCRASRRARRRRCSTACATSPPAGAPATDARAQPSTTTRHPGASARSERCSLSCMRPARVRPLIVPSGTPSAVAISDCDRPP